MISRFREAIQKSGFSYVELEKKTGISKSALQRYATGNVKKVPVNVIEKIAEVTKTNPCYLVGWSDGCQALKQSEEQKGKNNA